MQTPHLRITPLSPPTFRTQWLALDAVARERKYLMMLRAPAYEKCVEYFESMMGEQGVFMQAFEGERVVGWCDVRRSEFEVSAHCGTLGMGIIDGYRGAGLGRRLIEATVDGVRARMPTLERIELTIYSGNARALRLYANCGFIEEGRKIAARRTDGVTSDVILMAKKLS
jgi:RimJ/RimL family protein N-acetyltransferase